MAGTDLGPFQGLVPLDGALAVVAVRRPDGSVQASVVCAGVLPHPVTGIDAVGIVAAGGSRKLDLLRADPRATVVLRAGFRWAAVEGAVDLAGPDDPLAGLPADALPGLLRDIFVAAGGTHDDWDAYDAAMAAERRTALLITPERAYGNA